MKGILDVLIVALGAVGGYYLLTIATEGVKRYMLTRKLRKLSPCKCGGTDLFLGVGYTDMMIVCRRCKRKCDGSIDDAIKRWNCGESDNV